MNLFLSFFLLTTGCNTTTANEVAAETPDPIEESLNRASESLDRTIEMSEEMVKDMELMNQNMDAVFQAVTGCETEEACQKIKDDYAKMYEERRGKAN